MSASITSEHTSGDSEFLKDLSRWNTIFRLSIAAILLVGLCAVARGQSAQSSVEVYADAIKQSVIAQRIVAMEHYLTLSSGGSLKTDALEFLIWDHMRLGHQAQSLQHAQELLAIAPNNALAIAVLNQDPPQALGKNALEKRLVMLKSAGSGLERLGKPEGMPNHNFDALRRQVAIMLSGATGLCYLRLQDYPAARQSLQEAVNNDPNNAQWVYSLALALLNGKNRDEYRGHWYLARAANLTEQMPQGRAIAEYARRKYKDDGGKDAGWQVFIASAAALDAPPSPAGSNQGSKAVVAGANSKAGSAHSDRSQEATVASSKSVPAKIKPVSIDSDKRRSSKAKAAFGFEDTLREPERSSISPAREPEGPRALAAPHEAVSLGILIETSLLTSHNREAIISTLRDIVHNLRSKDEACILVFSDQLDFEQDLTADDHLLEEALEQIRPKTGKALLSGISFAAGHLKRIGRNNNRILLVISDGVSKSASADALAFRSQVTGVRIDCIGLKAAGATERALLQRIAAYSGGTTSFASSPQEFRTATLEMTRNLGIAVP
ncbi:MAG TPA: VWA domain-containing protein [Candidatus Angelobacter sp.]|nr:VWA domain-containing protein [Candidatus Angelobacter sp.]